MRILLTNWILSEKSGTETYLMALCRQLIKMGHDLTLYCKVFGWYGEEFKKMGIPVYVNKVPKEKFDIIHLHHNSCVKDLAKITDTPKIFVSHGVLPELEVPPLNIDYSVAVSEEVFKEFFKDELDASIIRNPIDMEEYKSETEIHDRLEHVAVITNKMNDKHKEEIEKACDRVKATVSFIGSGFGTHTADVKTEIEKADLVIGSGRCIYEAMSMGRAVIVYDVSGLDGIIRCHRDFAISAYCNCSSRSKGWKVKSEQIEEELRKYHKEQGKFNRDLIKDFNNSEVIAKEFEDLYKEIIKQYAV
jgi:glycosyltransferase involved in cell wall biosynthesis